MKLKKLIDVFTPFTKKFGNYKLVMADGMPIKRIYIHEKSKTIIFTDK